MVDFDNANKATTGAAAITAKKAAEQFAAVRERGMLNAGLDVIAKRFEEQNPGRVARWEYYSPTADNGQDQVTMREGMGWVLADYTDLGDKTASAPKKGLIRRGDLVLMSADVETDTAYKLQDQLAAHADLRAPETAFKDALDKKRVQLNDGTTDQARGVGQIKVREEMVSARPDKDSGGGS